MKDATTEQLPGLQGASLLAARKRRLEESEKLEGRGIVEKKEKLQRRKRTIGKRKLEMDLSEKRKDV